MRPAALAAAGRAPVLSVADTGSDGSWNGFPASRGRRANEQEPGTARQQPALDAAAAPLTPGPSPQRRGEGDAVDGRLRARRISPHAGMPGPQSAQADFVPFQRRVSNPVRIRVLAA